MCRFRRLLLGGRLASGGESPASAVTADDRWRSPTVTAIGMNSGDNTMRKMTIPERYDTMIHPFRLRNLTVLAANAAVEPSHRVASATLGVMPVLARSAIDRGHR